MPGIKHSSSKQQQTMNGFSPKETKALAELRARLTDVSLAEDQDDYYLLKWIKARCYNTKKAEAMFRASMTYRQKMRVKQLLEEFKPPEVIEKYLTGGFCGVDKDGSPVRVELFGYLDMRGIMCSCRKSDLEKSKLRQCETIVQMWAQNSKQLGRRVDGLTVIFDMENVGTKSLWRPGLEMYLHMVKVLEDNYPEMMKRMYVINAPGIFPLLWKICRPLISEDMKNKIHVLGGNFKEELLKAIDAEQLPVCYGGTLTSPDGDVRCPHKICQGGPVPQHFYLSESEDVDKMDSTVIAQGKKLRIGFTVDRPGSLLRWEFRTEDYDIGFGVVRVSGEDGEDDEDRKEEDVVPVERRKCHQVAEDGTVVCDKPGQYEVVFDNSYSWTKGKQLLYSVELHCPPDAAMEEEVDHVTAGGSWTKLSRDSITTHL